MQLHGVLYADRTTMNLAPTDTTLLVPLTASLYVPGKLHDPENVIVDVGTGYYVKKVWIANICWSSKDR